MRTAPFSRQSSFVRMALISLCCLSFLNPLCGQVPLQQLSIQYAAPQGIKTSWSIWSQMRVFQVYTAICHVVQKLYFFAV